MKTCEHCGELDSFCTCRSDNPTTDLLPLQLWLAKQLPEEIEICRSGDFWNKKTNNFVTICEWEYITRRVEEKLTISQVVIYDNLLEETSDKLCVATWNLPWPTRTIALMKMEVETV